MTDNCARCASAHWENTAKQVLYCCRKHETVDHLNSCDNFMEDRNDEKMCLNLEFIRVLKLLQLC